MLNLISGATIAEKAVNSGNPWIYLTIFLIVAAALAGRYTFNYLIKLDQSHREESKERERKMNEQLDKSIEANMKFSETQQEIVSAINMMGATVNDIKTDMKDLHSRMDKFENKGERSQWN